MIFTVIPVRTGIQIFWMPAKSGMTGIMAL